MKRSRPKASNFFYLVQNCAVFKIRLYNIYEQKDNKLDWVWGYYLPSLELENIVFVTIWKNACLVVVVAQMRNKRHTLWTGLELTNLNVYIFNCFASSQVLMKWNDHSNPPHTQSKGLFKYKICNLFFNLLIVFFCSWYFTIQVELFQICN